MPRGTPAPQEHKDQAARLYMQGDSLGEIVAALRAAHGITYTTRAVSNWMAAGGWTVKLRENLKTADKLEAHISRLAHKKTPTYRDTCQIAALSKTLQRLKKASPTPKPRAAVRINISDSFREKIIKPDYGGNGLYRYQREFVLSDSRFRKVLKSRQIGFSYIIGLETVLGAVAGRPQLVISASELQSQIILKYARLHAGLLGVGIDDDNAKYLKINGAEIRAMPANFRTIQGWPGDVYLDEYAWHHRAKLIWQAVVPSITAVGGRVTVCSTPFVPGNHFWELMEDPKGQYQNWESHKITIHDAIAQGMPLPGGLEELRGLFDSESWALMYECHWAEDGSALLSWDVLHAAATAEETRFWDGWIYSGVDVGRKNDLFVDARIGEQDGAFRLLHAEMKKGITYQDMRALLHDGHRRYKIKRQLIDRTGIGDNLAEDMVRAYPGVVAGRHFSAQRKEDWALNMLKLMEDKRFLLYNDPFVLAQFHAVKKSVAGNKIKYDAARGEDGHADLFWASALALEGLGDNRAGHGRGCIVRLLG